MSIFTVAAHVGRYPRRRCFHLGRLNRRPRWLGRDGPSPAPSRPRTVTHIRDPRFPSKHTSTRRNAKKTREVRHRKRKPHRSRRPTLDPVAAQLPTMVVEEITEGVKNLAVAGDAAAAGSGGEGQRRGGGGSSNRIQVSNTKKPLFFYVNLAKRYMQQHGDVELSALGMAIATVVTVAEILKNNGFAVEKKIRTSTVEINDDSRGRPFQKAKIEIILGKSDKFDELMAAAAEERGEVEDGEEQA